MTIASRPAPPIATSATLPSHFQIGDIVVFAPAALMSRPHGVYVSWIGLSALVVGVKFVQGKVFYDLAMQEDGGYYVENPLMNVDSIFVEHSIQAKPGQQYLQP
jgi:hypothetical protein